MSKLQLSTACALDKIAGLHSFHAVVEGPASEMHELNSNSFQICAKGLKAVLRPYMKIALKGYNHSTILCTFKINNVLAGTVNLSLDWLLADETNQKKGIENESV